MVGVANLVISSAIDSIIIVFMYPSKLHCTSGLYLPKGLEFVKINFPKHFFPLLFIVSWPAGFDAKVSLLNPSVEYIPIPYVGIFFKSDDPVI